MAKHFYTKLVSTTFNTTAHIILYIVNYVYYCHSIYYSYTIHSKKLYLCIRITMTGKKTLTDFEFTFECSSSNSQIQVIAWLHLRSNTCNKYNTKHAINLQYQCCVWQKLYTAYVLHFIFHKLYNWYNLCHWISA